MGVSTSFLYASWDDFEDFKTVKAIIKALKVINDNVERGVALIRDFSGLLIKEEGNLQFLKFVGEYRKLFPNSKKSIITPTRQC